MSISSGGAMLGRGGLGPFKCFLKKIEIYALINEISQNFRRFFKEVSFYTPPPLSVCFLEKLLWFNNFPKKEKENQKMPISRFLKRKKKSLQLTLVLKVEGACISYTFFFFSSSKNYAIDADATASRFVVYVLSVFSFVSLSHLPFPSLLYFK